MKGVERPTISSISKRRVEEGGPNPVSRGLEKRSISVSSITTCSGMRSGSGIILRKTTRTRQSDETSDCNTLEKLDRVVLTNSNRSKPRNTLGLGHTSEKSTATTRSYSDVNLKTLDSIKGKGKTVIATKRDNEVVTQTLISSKLTTNTQRQEKEIESKLSRKVGEKGEERRYNYCQLCRGSAAPGQIKGERPHENGNPTIKDRIATLVGAGAKCGSAVVGASFRLGCEHESSVEDLNSDSKREEALNRDSVEFHRRIFSNRKNVSLDDFHTIAIIGQGGYSIVRLVFDLHTGYEYALKQAKKSQIITRRVSPAFKESDSLSDIDINYSKREALASGDNGKGNHSSIAGKSNVGDEAINHSGGSSSSLNTGTMLNTEISLMYSSDSPWINKLYYYWEDSHFYYMLMEYMPGGDLMRHLMEFHTFEEGIARFYIAELLLALDYLNNTKKYIHRDIKPDNILLDSSGHIKLIDFGLSKQIKSNEKQLPFVSNVLQNIHPKSNKANYCPSSENCDIEIHDILIHDSNFHAGTPDYMAPEIHRGEAYTLSVDLWSVGIILYEMLFGGPPLSDPGQNSLITRNKVMNWEKYFYLPSEHHKYSADAIDFICCLISEPDRRIRTVKEAMKHPFFKDVDFNNLRQQTPPIVPKVKHRLDYSNFDKFTVSVLVNFYNSVKATPTIPISCVTGEIHSSFMQTNNDGNKLGVNKHSSFESNDFNNNTINPNIANNVYLYSDNSACDNHCNKNLNLMGGKLFSSSIHDLSPKFNCSTNKLLNSICTPKRSYIPVTFSPSSNSTSASSWRYNINGSHHNSPFIQTYRNPSPFQGNIDNNVLSLNSPIFEKPLFNINRKNFDSLGSNVGKINQHAPEFNGCLQKSSCDDTNSKPPHIFATNTKNNFNSNENVVHQKVNHFNSANPDVITFLSKQKLSNIRNSSISKNNQHIINMLRKI